MQRIGDAEVGPLTHGTVATPTFPGVMAHLSSVQQLEFDAAYLKRAKGRLGHFRGRMSCSSSGGFSALLLVLVDGDWAACSSLTDGR